MYTKLVNSTYIFYLGLHLIFFLETRSWKILTAVTFAFYIEIRFKMSNTKKNLNKTFDNISAYIDRYCTQAGDELMILCYIKRTLIEISMIIKSQKNFCQEITHLLLNFYRWPYKNMIANCYLRKAGLKAQKILRTFEPRKQLESWRDIMKILLNKCDVCITLSV